MCRLGTLRLPSAGNITLNAGQRQHLEFGSAFAKAAGLLEPDCGTALGLSLYDNVCLLSGLANMKKKLQGPIGLMTDCLELRSS